MGIELIFGAASLAVGIIGNASAAGARRESAAAQKEVNEITIAQNKIEARENRRQLLREERLRRARLAQGSFNVGTAGSSGEAGAASAIGTNVENILSAQRGATRAAEGVNTWQQKAIDFENQARETLAWTDVFQSGIGTFGNIFSNIKQSAT